MIEFLLAILLIYGALILLSCNNNVISRVIWTPFLILIFRMIETSAEKRKKCVKERRIRILSFFKTLFVGKSKVFKGYFIIGNDINTVEQEIDILIREIDQKENLTNKGIVEFNKLDLEVMIAHITSKLEWAKAVQFALAFIAIFFVSLTGLFMWMNENEFFQNFFGSPGKVYFIILVTAVVSFTVFDISWKNQLRNYTYLKELLLIYKKDKYKEI